MHGFSSSNKEDQICGTLWGNLLRAFAPYVWVAWRDSSFGQDGSERCPCGPLIRPEPHVSRSTAGCPRILCCARLLARLPHPCAKAYVGRRHGCHIVLKGIQEVVLRAPMVNDQRGSTVQDLGSQPNRRTLLSLLHCCFLRDDLIHIIHSQNNF